MGLFCRNAAVDSPAFGLLRGIPLGARRDGFVFSFCMMFGHPITRLAPTGACVTSVGLFCQNASVPVSLSSICPAARLSRSSAMALFFQFARYSATVLSGRHRPFAINGFVL
jgi:hypothetical protein